MAEHTVTIMQKELQGILLLLLTVFVPFGSIISIINRSKNLGFRIICKPNNLKIGPKTNDLL